LSGFYNSSNGLIDLVTNPADNLLQFQNSENVIGKGIEFEVGGEWASGWKIRLADTFQQSYDSQNRANQFASPRQLPKINVIAPLPWRKLFIGTEAQYITRMLTTQGSQLGGFLIANAPFPHRSASKASALRSASTTFLISATPIPPALATSRRAFARPAVETHLPFPQVDRSLSVAERLEAQ
jgi:hypothetical protein